MNVTQMLSMNTGWEPFNHGKTIGQAGSEGGQLLLDEGHADGARISLERVATRRLFRTPKYAYAITCGVYGWMVHTRFFESEIQARSAFEEMKSGLVAILEALPLESDPHAKETMHEIPSLLREFVARFPAQAAA